MATWQKSEKILINSFPVLAHAFILIHMKNLRTARKEEDIVYIGITKKGSLAERVTGLLEQAGYLDQGALKNTRKMEIPSTQDNIRFRCRSGKGMPYDVIRGIVDAGITGSDVVANHNLDKIQGVTVVANMQFSRASDNPARLVVATRPDLTGINNLDECKGRRIATEFVPLTRRQLMELHGFTENDCRNIYKSEGATEGDVLFGLADAASDISETGATYRENDFIELAELFRSTPVIVSNNVESQNPSIKNVIDKIACDLLDVLALQQTPMILMRMNVIKSKLDAVLKALPSEDEPDYSAGETIVSVTTMMPQSMETSTVARLMGHPFESGDVNSIIVTRIDRAYTNKSRALLYPKMNGG